MNKYTCDKCNKNFSSEKTLETHKNKYHCLKIDIHLMPDLPYSTPEKDIEMFKVIYHLLKEQGYTIEGAKRRLKENKEEAMNVSAIAGRLNRIKEELIKIKENL